MGKLLIKAVVAVVYVGAVVFSGWVLTNTYLAKRDTKVAQAVMNNIAVSLINEVKKAGEVGIVVKDKDGKDIKIVLVEKQESQPIIQAE